MLLYGHAGTIEKPVIARRNNHRLYAVSRLQESFSHDQPRLQSGPPDLKVEVIGVEELKIVLDEKVLFWFPWMG